MSIKLHVIVVAYNCEKFITSCLKMLTIQTYDNWDGVIIDDASTDSTAEIIRKQSPQNMKLFFNKQRQKALANQHKAILASGSGDEDVIVMNDGDDWLYDKDSLKKLAKYYEDPNTWMTYGSYIHFPSGKKGVIHVPVPKNYDFRTSRWVLTHLRTFKYFLYKNIFVEDLKSKKTKDFYETSADCAVMKPIAEMAGWEHIKCVPEVLLTYNGVNPLGDGKIHRTLQGIRGKEIALSPRYRKRTRQELVNGIKER